MKTNPNTETNRARVLAKRMKVPPRLGVNVSRWYTEDAAQFKVPLSKHTPKVSILEFRAYSGRSWRLEG